MWALIKDNEIDHIIAHPKSMVIDDIRHPRAIFTVWSDADLKAIGIVPVTTSGSHLDARFYIEKNEVFALAEDGNSVIRTIGEKATDKKLTDTDNVDENGDPILDDHDNQRISLGLKSQAKLQSDRYANGSLQGFNWLVQRKVTADTAIPSDVTTYMAAVRTAHASIHTAIDNAADMDAFVALYPDIETTDWPDDYGVKGYKR